MVRDGAWHIEVQSKFGVWRHMPNVDSLEQAKQDASDTVIKTPAIRARVISNVTGGVIATFVKSEE